MAIVIRQKTLSRRFLIFFESHMTYRRIVIDLDLRITDPIQTTATKRYTGERLCQILSDDLDLIDKDDFDQEEVDCFTMEKQ
jgi:hypothetical protein